MMSKELGILNSEHHAAVALEMSRMDAEIQRLHATHAANGQTLAQVLKRPELCYQDMPQSDAQLSAKIMEQVEYSIKYEGYLQREMREVARMETLECEAIPADFGYADIHSLRFEAREKFSRIRPATLGQALRIPGITPADIAVVHICMRRKAAAAP